MMLNVILKTIRLTEIMGGFMREIVVKSSKNILEYYKEIQRNIDDADNLSKVQIEKHITNNKPLYKKVCANLWYGYYKYIIGGKDVEKTVSDYYEFNKNGTFTYHYTDGRTLYGIWTVWNNKLHVYYINGNIGYVKWWIDIMIIDGHKTLVFYGIIPKHKGIIWLYADVPVSELK